MIQPLDRPKSSWFGLGLAVQFLLMIAVPAPAIYTQMTGQRVILKTIPVDPYDPLRGYSTTLRYDISDMQLLRTLPGWTPVSRTTWKPNLKANLFNPNSASSNPVPPSTSPSNRPAHLHPALKLTNRGKPPPFMRNCPPRDRPDPSFSKAGWRLLPLTHNLSPTD